MRHYSRICMAALIILALFVTACGGPAAQKPATPGPAQPPAPAAKPEAPKEPPKAEPPGTWYIGTLFETSGPAATYGTEAMQGIKLGIKQINDKGGIKIGNKTYKIEPVMMDNRSLPEETAAGYKRLAADDKVTAVLGPFLSANALAIRQLADQYKLPTLTLASTSQLLSPEMRYLFRVQVALNVMLPPLAPPIVKGLGMDKGRVIFLSIDNAFGKDVEAQYKRELGKAGANIVGSEWFAQDQTDFYAVLQRVKALNPTHIVLASLTQTTLPLWPQLREVLGNDVLVFETAGSDMDKLVATVKNPGTFAYLSRMDPAKPEWQKLVQEHKAAYNSDPTGNVSDAYDAFQVLVSAAVRAGSIERDKIREGLRNTKHEMARCGVLKFNDYGENDMPNCLGYFLDGKMVRFDPGKVDGAAEYAKFVQARSKK